MHLLCFYIRTIPLAFRRGASSLLPLRQPLPFPQPLQKNNNPFASHYVLASLVKGRWIDGKAQTVALLRFTCDTPAFFIHQIFLPSRRRDCLPLRQTSTPLQPSQNRTIPCLAPTPMPFNERSVSAISQKELSVTFFHSQS